MILLNNHSITRRRKCTSALRLLLNPLVCQRSVFVGADAAAPQPGPPPAAFAVSRTGRDGLQRSHRFHADLRWQEPRRLGGRSHGLARGEWRHRWRIHQGQRGLPTPTSGATISKRKDFDLKLEIKCEIAGGSGIQYRSQTGLPWNKPSTSRRKATQSRLDDDRPAGRFLVSRSTRCMPPTPASSTRRTRRSASLHGAARSLLSAAGPPPTLIGTIGDRSALGGYVKVNDWNQYEIIARGGTFLHILNGQLMAVYIDDDPASSNNKSGKIGIELEGTPAKVSVRNIWIKKLN